MMEKKRIMDEDMDYQKQLKYEELGKKQIEGELYDQCINIVEIVKGQCMGKASTEETKAFFYKMIGIINLCNLI